jgi:hypothetical protein
MAEKKDIKNLQLFHIIRQQYIAQLLDTFKKEYREQHHKDPDKELVDVFLAFLEKHNDMVDQMVEKALQETVDHLKEVTSQPAAGNEQVASHDKSSKSKSTSNGFEKFREVVIMPFLIGGIAYTLSQKDWVTTGILGFAIILLGSMWWFGRK